MTQFNAQITQAHYQDPGLREYANNPFICALPLIRDSKAAAREMKMRPTIDEIELNLEPHLRVHAIQRLVTGFFQPFTQHIILEAKFALLIRQGYLGRNPSTPDYKVHLNNGHDRIVHKDINLTVRQNVVSTASDFSIVGPSGCGKSKAISRCLDKYPRAIYHPDLHIIQVPWIKLECPRNGSLVELCLDFFIVLDNLLGTQYRSKYGKARSGVGVLITEMSQLCNLHAVGVLIIDEIQNLSRQRAGGDDAMLTFFLSLTNTIGVPVVLVGTPRAHKLYSKDFKIARRITSLGSVSWDRMEQNNNWGMLIETLWKYQWLKKKSELTDELIQVLYDLSQGVIDILIKLYMLSQWRAMITGVESLSVRLIEAVYADELKPVHRMLKALKSGDPTQIEKYDDLVMPSIEQKFIQAFDDESTYVLSKPVSVLSSENTDKKQILMTIATALGVSQDIAIPLIEHELLKNPDMDTMLLANHLMKLLNGEKVNLAKKTGRSKKPNTAEWQQLDQKDMRYLFSIRGDGTMYEMLSKVEIVCSVDDFLKIA